LVVTGQLKLYGKRKLISSTKLKNTVNAGENAIKVLDEVDWKVGDEVLITPTELSLESYETRKIVSIDNADKT